MSDPAAASAGRIAALRHETVDHAVEHHAVVKAFIGQLGNALDMAGSEVGAQFDGHFAGVECEIEGVVIGHA